MHNALQLLESPSRSYFRTVFKYYEFMLNGTLVIT